MAGTLFSRRFGNMLAETSRQCMLRLISFFLISLPASLLISSKFSWTSAIYLLKLSQIEQSNVLLSVSLWQSTMRTRNNNKWRLITKVLDAKLRREM